MSLYRDTTDGNKVTASQCTTRHHESQLIVFDWHTDYSVTKLETKKTVISLYTQNLYIKVSTCSKDDDMGLGGTVLNLSASDLVLETAESFEGGAVTGLSVVGLSVI